MRAVRAAACDAMLTYCQEYEAMRLLHKHSGSKNTDVIEVLRLRSTDPLKSQNCLLILEAVDL